MWVRVDEGLNLGSSEGREGREKRRLKKSLGGRKKIFIYIQLQCGVKQGRDNKELKSK